MAHLLHPIILEDLNEILVEGLPFERLFGCRILVSGANGFLPSYFVRALLHLNTKHKAGIRVIALVRNVEKARVRFAEYLGPNGQSTELEFFHSDLSVPFEVEGPVDYIVHAAGQASPKFYGSDPVGSFIPGAVGTYHLLECARKKSAKGFLFISTGEVYGVVSADKMPVDELTLGYLDPATVRACYGESKRAGETLCVGYAHQYGLNTVIARTFHTYGPGMALDDGRVFADFVANILSRKNIEMKSDGSAIRPYCYLSDYIRGLFVLLLKGEKGQAYNIGNPAQEVSVLELAQTLVDLYPALGLKVVRAEAVAQKAGYLQSPIPRNCPDISKIQKLGWQPKHDIKSGFMRTIESFRPAAGYANYKLNL